MDATCHRCHQSFPADSAFCPHCGAAQLYVTAEQMEDEAAAGNLPPLQRVSRIDWHRALLSSLMVAAAAAVLSALAVLVPVLSIARFLWILTASTTTLWFYLKPAPNRPMDGGIGARLGTVTGLAISFLTTFSTALLMVIQRYVLHRGAAMDAAFADMLKRLGEFYKSVGIDAQQQQLVFSLLRSPEGHAGQMLSEFAMRAVFITSFLALVGAISGMARKSRRRVAG